ncbi:MAG: PQQ-binding-like beta-propeller repeat protein [Methyloceanibacter sp.]
MVGGALATAGGLLFAGESDGWFRAYDSATGKVPMVLLCGCRRQRPSGVVYGGWQAVHSCGRWW